MGLNSVAFYFILSISNIGQILKHYECIYYFKWSNGHENDDKHLFCGHSRAAQVILGSYLSPADILLHLAHHNLQISYIN